MLFLNFYCVYIQAYFNCYNSMIIKLACPVSVIVNDYEYILRCLNTRYFYLVFKMNICAKRLSEEFA